MAALIVAVAALTGCSKEEIGGDGLTFTTTVQMPAGGTKALDEHGVKTFAVGERIKVTCDGGSKTCTSEALTSADISADGKAAKFTFNFASAPTLSSGSTVTYEYPAAHSGLGGQNGTLATLQSTYDYASCSPYVSVAGQLPTNITLENQYAILKLNLNDGSRDITSDVRQLTITLGGQTVTVNRTPAAGPVYVAVPAASGSIVFYAAKGKDLYTKSVSQTLTAGHLYPVNLSMSSVEGALSGLFSVSASKKVYFSKGNLMAVFIGSSEPIYTSPTWKFADNQWGCVGNAAANNAITGDGTVSTAGSVDLFGWSTTSTAYGIHNSTNDYDYHGNSRDWGTNAITNGGNTENSGWYTLSKTEWEYLIDSSRRTNWGRATVAGICGLIILPDNYSGTAITPGDGSNWNTNSIDASSWASNYEAYGAVFLPAAGYRTGTTMFYDPSFTAENRRGYYWSSTSYGDYGGHYVDLGISNLNTFYTSRYGFWGMSVRLVRVAN
jgi:hypothetical protein